ncbi:cell surface protein precursor [Bacillus sp. JCM 19046]|nr:cell surface protein precursor [Bacillus sp. JCM 19045]GAF20052.1 cell surface protein precursor [Bacillus sp. JCM 19046]
MKRLSWALSVLLFSLLVPTSTANASEFNFSVTTVIPDNQTDPSKTYYDLLMEPGQTQTLEMVLRNDTSEDVTLNPAVHSATTNVNGVVEYGLNEIEADPTLSYPIDQWLTIEEELIIPAESEIVLPLEVSMPNESFDGILAGGITLQEQLESSTDTTDGEDQGLSIENEYAYVVGIVLQQSEQTLTPELELLNVSPGQLNARNVIQATIQNPVSMYVNQLEVKAAIKSSSTGEVFFETEKEMMQMAPNSQFGFPIPLNGAPLEAGEYTLEMTAKAMGAEWSWSEPFTIDADEAGQLNATDVSIPPTDYTWLYVSIGIALVFASIILFWWRRRQKKQQVGIVTQKNPPATAS